jgi:hypothetical protein
MDGAGILVSYVATPGDSDYLFAQDWERMQHNMGFGTEYDDGSFVYTGNAPMVLDSTPETSSMMLLL